MNFDEIKQSMELEKNNLTIPLSLTDLNSSQNAISTVQKAMIVESIFRTAAVLFLLLFPLSNKLHEMANGIYIYSILIFAAIAVLHIVKFLIFIRKKSDLSHNSKDALQSYNNDLKTLISSYRAAGTADTIALILPTTILFVGNKYASLATLDNFIHMNYSPLQFLIAGLSFIVLVIFINWYSHAWSKYSYEKYIKKIELILEQYKD